MFSFLVHTSSFYSFPCPKFLFNRTWFRKTLKLMVRKQPLTIKPLSFIGSPSDAGGKGRLCTSRCFDKTQYFPLLLRFANSGLSSTNLWIFFFISLSPMGYHLKNFLYPIRWMILRDCQPIKVRFSTFWLWYFCCHVTRSSLLLRNSGRQTAKETGKYKFSRYG